VETLHLDTHIAIWLFSGEWSSRLKIKARKLEKYLLQVSPIVEMEMQFLYEIKRINYSGTRILRELIDTIGLTISPAPFCDIIRQSHLESWTRDPFDRIIVANAKLDGARLLSADRRILVNFPKAISA